MRAEQTIREEATGVEPSCVTRGWGCAGHVAGCSAGRSTAGTWTRPKWFRRRERWLEQYRDAHGGQEPVCVVCGALWTLRGGDLHHRTYARLGAETWQDLVPMCRDHHAALHAGDRARIRPGERFRGSRRPS